MYILLVFQDLMLSMSTMQIIRHGNATCKAGVQQSCYPVQSMSGGTSLGWQGEFACAEECSHWAEECFAPSIGGENTNSITLSSQRVITPNGLGHGQILNTLRMWPAKGQPRQKAANCEGGTFWKSLTAQHVCPPDRTSCSASQGPAVAPSCASNFYMTLASLNSSCYNLQKTI